MGFGPGAHSHVGRMRWWNVKNPGAYAGRPECWTVSRCAGEVLGSDARELERVMLGVRTSEGVEIEVAGSVLPDGTWLTPMGVSPRSCGWAIDGACALSEARCPPRCAVVYSRTT